MCFAARSATAIVTMKHRVADNRPDWDEYYLGIADRVKDRADCTRRQIGAILVNEHNRHRGSGYNGGRSKGPSCLLGECPRGLSDVAPGSSYDTGAGVCVAIHAEQNLIMDTTPEERLNGSIYITDEPCDGCLRMLQGSGVVRIIWPKGIWCVNGFQGAWDKFEYDVIPI